MEDTKVIREEELKGAKREIIKMRDEIDKVKEE